MKKNNNKGFILLETLIVSTFVIGVLVFLYVQFNNIKRSYDESFKYNSIPGLYGAIDIKKYFNNIGYNTLKTELQNSSLGYIELSSSYISGDSNYYDTLTNSLNIKYILFTQDNLDTLKSYLTNNQETFITTYTSNLYEYVNRTSINSTSNNYRLFIAYNDNTYTSIALD